MSQEGAALCDIDVIDWRGSRFVDRGGGGIEDRVTGSEFGAGPMLVRRQLGRQLRALRERAGKTHGDVETAGMAHRSTVWRIEAGRSKANPAVVRGLCWLYGVDEQTSDSLYEMAMQGQKPGWWEAYGSDLPSWFSLYVGLEAEACGLSTFQQPWVPGLLQTPDYARAALAEGSATTGSELDRQVALRLARQRAVFERPEPLDLRIVLDEGALRRPIGGLTVLREQQEHLRLLNRRPHIDVRVLPLRLSAR